MDLTKLLGNPMQDMMGQELANIFKRIGGGGQQGPMSPMQQPQMSQMPQQQYNPFGNQQNPEMDEWEQMRDQMMQQQGINETDDEAEQDRAYKAQWFNENREALEPAVAPLLEGFPDDQRAEWMDAFIEAMHGGDDEFLETVRNEVGEENQKEWDDIVAHFMEAEPASVSEYLSKHFAEDEEDSLEQEMLSNELMNGQAQEEDAEIDEALTLGSGNPSDQDIGEVDEEGVPVGGVSFDKMKAAEQNAVSKQMREESNKAQKLVKAHRTLDAMKKIVKEHPNMADEMGAVFANPAEQPGFLDQLKRDMALGVGILNKKDLAAYEKFTKLSSELVLDAGEALGTKNFTDAKLKLIQRSKPSGRMTDEALNYVIDHMMYDWEPAQDYANAIEKGRRGRYQPEMNMESYRKGKKDLSIEEAEKLLAEMENG